MFLGITGFLLDDREDDSIKFAFNVEPELEQPVMDLLGWESMEAEVVGDLPLTITQSREIAAVLKQALPTDLDLFIGVRP